MTSYSAGEASLRIVPNVDDFKRDMAAKMKSVKAEFRLPVTADVGQAATDIKRFREVQSREGIRLGLAMGLAEADADMARFREKQRREGLVIRAELEDAEARAKLAELRARERAQNVKIKVDADTGGALHKIHELDSTFDHILHTIGEGLSFDLKIAGIGEIPAATMAIAQLTGGIEQLAQGGLAIPGIMAGVAASVGALTLGLSGVSGAYEAITSASKTAGQEQLDHTREVMSATNAYKNAVMDEAQAERERTRAVRDARDSLQDLNIQLRGGKISEQQAINNALRQRRDLMKDMMTGQIKDQLDLQQRLLDIQAADQAVVESHQRNAETQEKVNDANAKGITNADLVVQANDRLTKSQQAVVQTKTDLADVTQKQTEGAKAVALAMAKLSPNAAQFVQTLVDMKGQFKDLKNEDQDNLFAGMSQSLKTLVASDMPNFKAGLGGLATAWNGTLKQLFSSLGSDSSKGLLDRILGDTTKAQNEFTKAIDPLVHGIGTLTAASADALPRLADGIGKVGEEFDHFITEADQDGRLDKWINDGITGFTQIGNTLLNVGSAIGAITKAAGGDGFLGTLERGSKKLADFLNSTKGQNELKKWFQDARDEINNNIIPLLKELPGDFDGIIKAGKSIADTVLPPLKDISHFLGEHPQLIKDIVIAFSAWKGISAIASLATDLGKISDILGAGGKGAKGSGGKGILGKIGLLAAALGALHLLNDATSVDDPDVKPTTVGDRAGNIAGDAAADAAAGLQVGGLPGAAAGGLLGVGEGIYDNATQDINAGKQKNLQKWQQDQAAGPDRPGSPERANKGTARDGVLQPSLYNPDGTLKPTAGTDLRAQIAAGNVHGFTIGPDGRILGPDGKPVNLPGYSLGGPTPSGPGNGPTGGYLAEIHPDEWVLPAGARRALGDQALWALTRGRSFKDGGTVDENGNPVTPGNLPGPGVAGPDPGYQPIAPNPMGSTGVMSAVGSFVSGLGVPMQRLSGMIPALTGQPGLADGAAAVNPAAGLAGVGNTGAMLPGLWGLPGAMQGGDAGMQMWGQQTGNWLANWGGNTLAKLGGTLYKGVLDFFGLGNSILSPSNSWFQAGAQSLGVFDKLAPMFGWGNNLGGNLAIGTQTVTLGDGTQLPLSTFGTSGTPGNAGIAPVGASEAQVESFAQNLIASGTVYNTAARTDCSGIVSKAVNAYLGNPASGDLMSTPVEGAWLQGKGAVMVTDPSQLPAGTLRIGWSDSHTAATLPNGQNLESSLPGQPVKLGAGAGGATETGFTHWAYFIPGTTAPSNASSVAAASQPINPANFPNLAAPAGTPGDLPVPLPAGISGGGRGAGMNLALAAGRHAPAGGAESWRPAVRAALAKYGPAFGITNIQAWEDAMVRQLATESGGNPGADNPNDKNGRGGTQHVSGIAQFLLSTFNANNISGGSYLDPYAQIAAMIPYVAHKYGMNSVGGPNFIGEGHGYAFGGASRGPGGPKGDQIPAMLSDNEHVFTSEDVNAMGGQANVYAFRAALHRADGGDIFQTGLVNPTPPPIPQLPDVQHITAPPPRASAVIPTAPTKQLPQAIPAPSAPPMPVAPTPEQPSQPQDFTQRYTPPPVVGAAPTDLNHNLSAINTGIKSGAALAGSLASSAISAAGGVGGMGIGGMGAGQLGQFVNGLIQEGGKTVSQAVNVVSSLLVGSVPGSGSSTARAAGETVHAPQRIPQTQSSSVQNNTFYGHDTNSVLQQLDIREAMAAQARKAKYGG